MSKKKAAVKPTTPRPIVRPVPKPMTPLPTPPRMAISEYSDHFAQLDAILDHTAQMMDYFGNAYLCLRRTLIQSSAFGRLCEKHLGLLTNEHIDAVAKVAAEAYAAGCAAESLGYSAAWPAIKP